MRSIGELYANNQEASFASFARSWIEWFGRDMAFQGLEAELADPPGKYLPPHGQLIVAIDDIIYLGRDL